MLTPAQGSHMSRRHARVIGSDDESVTVRRYTGRAEPDLGDVLAAEHDLLRCRVDGRVAEIASTGSRGRTGEEVVTYP